MTEDDEDGEGELVVAAELELHAVELCKFGAGGSSALSFALFRVRHFAEDPLAILILQGPRDSWAEPIGAAPLSPGTSV